MNGDKPTTIDLLKQRLNQIRDSIQGIESEISAIELQLSEGSLNPADEISELKKLSYSAETFAAGRSQDQILNTFMTEVSEFVDRGILLLASGDRLSARMSFGAFGGASLNVDISSQEGPIAESVSEKCIIQVQQPAVGLLPWLNKNESMPQEMVCIPFIFQDAVPLVFYGDSKESISVESIEILIKLAALVLQNHYLSYQAATGSDFGHRRWPVLETYGKPEEVTAVKPAAQESGLDLPPDLPPGFVVVDSTQEKEEAESRKPLEIVETSEGESTETVVADVRDQKEEEILDERPVHEPDEETVAAEEGEKTEEEQEEILEEELELIDDYIPPELVKDASFEEMMRFPSSRMVEAESSAVAEKLEEPVAEPVSEEERQEVGAEAEVEAETEEEAVQEEVFKTADSAIEATPQDPVEAESPEEKSASESGPTRFEGTEAEIREDQTELVERETVAESRVTEPETFPTEEFRDEQLEMEKAPEEFKEEFPGSKPDQDQVEKSPEESVLAEPSESQTEKVETESREAVDEPEEESLAVPPSETVAESSETEEILETEDEPEFVESKLESVQAPEFQPAEEEKSPDEQEEIEVPEELPGEPDADQLVRQDQVYDETAPEEVIAEGEILEEEVGRESPGEDTFVEEPSKAEDVSGEEVAEETVEYAVSTAEETSVEKISDESELKAASDEEMISEKQSGTEVVESVEETAVEEPVESLSPETEEEQRKTEEMISETGQEEEKSPVVEDEQAETEVDEDEMIRTVTFKSSPIEDKEEAEDSEAEKEAEGSGLTPEEEQSHSEAHRFARLLVAEIKLYNEDEVIEGRESKQLYFNLKRDIDRSREMYEKRAHPFVKANVDYFHSELIRVLAKNDPELMGPEYPGPITAGADDGDQ